MNIDTTFIAYRKRPVVLVDMDGPITGFDERAFELYAANGWAVEDGVDHTTQRHRWSTDHIIDDEHRAAARAYIDSTPGWFLELPEVPGAIAGLDELAEVADVWICTKPLEKNPTCRDDKARWLCEHDAERWMRRMIIAPDKSLVVGSVLLDDAHKQEWAEVASWAPVVFPTNWNGEGTEWEALPRWTWGDDPTQLLKEAPHA